jgi:hypothetical protein
MFDIWLPRELLFCRPAQETGGCQNQLILNLTDGHGNPISFKAELAFIDRTFLTHQALVMQGWCWWYWKYAPGDMVLEG